MDNGRVITSNGFYKDLKYSDKILEDLEALDFSEHIMQMARDGSELLGERVLRSVPAYYTVNQIETILDSEDGEQKLRNLITRAQKTRMVYRMIEQERLRYAIAKREDDARDNTNP